MYFFLLSYPLLGAGIKYIDDAFDEKRYNPKIALAVAPILGALWAYTMLIDRASATILLAVLCGVFLKGKIDNHAHLAGLFVILVIIAFAGIELMILPLLFLAPFALLDEVGNDVIDYNKKYFKTNKFWHKFIRYFFDQRWLLKIAILAFVLLGIVPYYFFIAILLFDGAYLIMRWYSHSRQKGVDILAISTKKAKSA